MSVQNCRHCGQETDGDLYCAECRELAGAKKARRLWVFSILFSALLALLTGLLFWPGELNLEGLSLDSVWGEPAAVINGERIRKAELKARMKTVQVLMERQYGKDIFAGGRGKWLLDQLERQVMDGILEERLIAQEARRLKIQIRDEQVEQEVQRICREIYGTPDNFQARLRKEGLAKEDLENHIRHILTYRAVRTTKAQPGMDPGISFQSWLAQAKKEAVVSLHDSGRPSFGGDNCCTLGQNSGRTRGQSLGASRVDPKTEEEARKVALEAFRKTHPDEGKVTGKVIDYGCHIQVDIQKEGRILKSYHYQNGKVREIS